NIFLNSSHDNDEVGKNCSATLLKNAATRRPLVRRRLQMTSTILTRHKGLKLFLLFAVPFVAIGIAGAQTRQFTYQGKLVDTSKPASGQYDFQFKLFDTAAVGSGTQVGNTLTLTSVAVSAGVFTVPLDFGTASFPGADRYLEIAVRPSGSPTYTTLSPRQPV